MNIQMSHLIYATALMIGLGIYAPAANSVTQDTTISGGPANTDITLFDTEHSNTGATTDGTTDGTTVSTDSNGQFNYACNPGERYLIDRGDGKEPDSFVCNNQASVCLADANAITRPIIQDLPVSEKTVKKAKEAVSGFAKGLLGGMGGGFGGMPMGGGRSDNGLVSKPRGKWQTFSNGETAIELNGWLYKPRSKKKEPEIRIAMRLDESPDKGAPHQMILQHQSGLILLPVGYMVFELWKNWKLTITVTRESYVDGELVSRSVTRSSYAWKELIERYAAIISLPAIWQQLGGENPKAFSKFRGVIAQFPLPENFNPAEWSLVTQVTSKIQPKNITPAIWNMALDQRHQQVGPDDQAVLLTVPLIANLQMHPKKKKDLVFVSAPDGRTFYQHSRECPPEPIR